MDDKRNSEAGAVFLRPRNIYGLHNDVIGNIHFNSNQEVIYPVEGVLAFHDYEKKKQRFLRFPEEILPEAIAISAHRKLLAVYERNANDGCSISVYELATFKKCRTLQLPGNYQNAKIIQISFTYDSRGIAILSKPPDEMIFLLMLDKASTVFQTSAKISGVTPPNVAECIACNPQETGFIAVGGRNTLLLMTKSDASFTINSNIKCNFHITSLTFCTIDMLLLGTSDDQLILVENAELKLRQEATEAVALDLIIDQEQFDREREAQFNRFAIPEETLELYDKRVVCMTAFTRGFAFAVFNRVFVFERVSKFKFERKTILTIPITAFTEDLYQIKNLAIDHKQETVIVTCTHAQIYTGTLFSTGTLKIKNVNFEPLGAMLHNGDIVDISLCPWKPIIMTASRDRTVRIWNYETDKVELVRKFQVDINIVELNSTGLMAAIGFSDQLRIVQIFLDDLNIVKTYNFPHCKSVRYSNMGHLMAAAFDNNITITSTYTLDVVKNLKGHSGTVLVVYWTKTDKYLISGGAEGAIYQWDIETGARLQEIVQKGTEYIALVATFNEPLTIYAATQYGILREFQNSQIVREITIPSKSKGRLTDVCIARSDQIMFVSNDEGNLYNIPYEYHSSTILENFYFFVSQVNILRFSLDDKMLIATSKSGTLAIWTLENVDGKTAPLDTDLLKSQEVLIPRHQLIDKNRQIANLELRLKQQAEEFEYQLSQNEIFDGQQLAEVHRSYCQALEELKDINNDIESRHANEMNRVTFQISDLKEEHQKNMEKLANQYSERMLIEYEKFTKLRINMVDLRESYEARLKNSTGKLQDKVEILENNYNRELDERKSLIRDLMREMQNKKSEFIEYCREVEIENENNIAKLQSKCENKVTDERNQTQMWRGKAGVLEKKHESISKGIDILLEEVESLKDEHNKSQRHILRLSHNIQDLQKDILDRENSITSKEKRIQELLHKNQDLDKNKQVLAHKIGELKKQVEPCEFEINDNRKRILELEGIMEELNQSNILLEAQLKEKKEKYFNNVAQLKAQRERALESRERIYQICTDIYKVAGKINSPQGLKDAVKFLTEKYANDAELKRYVELNSQVHAEFERQRAHVEAEVKVYKQKSDDKIIQEKHKEQFKLNYALVKEIQQLREQNNKLRAHVKSDIRKKSVLMKRKQSS